MPREAPVTRAVFPERLLMMGLLDRLIDSESGCAYAPSSDRRSGCHWPRRTAWVRSDGCESSYIDESSSRSGSARAMQERHIVLWHWDSLNECHSDSVA